MARSRASNRRSASPRRRMFWARRYTFVSYSPENYAFPTNLLNDFEQQYGADLFGFTVTRIVGNFTISMAETQLETSYWWSAGIRVGDQSTGTIADTDAEQRDLIPAADPHTDWMWVRNQQLWGSPSATALQRQPFHFDVDIKSQRRLDELGQSLYLIHGLTEAPPGEANLYVGLSLNVLCKRP